MTWKQEFFKAIMTSTLALDIFKSKQKNKKHFIQFLSRFFPFYYTNNKKNKKLLRNKQKATIPEELLILLRNYATGVNRSGVDCQIPLNLVINKSPILIDLLEKILKQENENNWFNVDHANHFCNISITCDSSNTEWDIHGGYSLSHILLNFFKFDKTLTLKTFLRVHAGCNHYTSAAQSTLDTLQILYKFGNIISEKTTPENIISTYRKDMNFGIEIEFDGQYYPLDIRKRFQNKGIISFESGIDNSSGERPIQTEGDRVRENRIRLNGIYGLKGLEEIINTMHKELQCTLPQEGSIHMHMDCEWDQIIINFRKIQDNFIEFQETVDKYFSPEVKLYLNLIFNINQMVYRIFSNYRLESKFKTIEFRNNTPLLNYTIIVSELLVNSHIAQCIKRLKPINLNIIKDIFIARNSITNEYNHMELEYVFRRFNNQNTTDIEDTFGYDTLYKLTQLATKL